MIYFTVLGVLLAYLIILLTRQPETETVTPKDLLDQIEAMRQALTGRIRNISVEAGADASGTTDFSQSLQNKEKRTMGTTPIKLTDVQSALTGLQADLTATVDSETSDIRGVVENLKAQIANGTPVTQADLQGLLDQISATRTSLTGKIQSISVGAGADTKGDGGGTGGGGTPAP